MAKIDHIKNVFMDITAPMPVDNQTMDFKMFNVMTGKNGTGKSFWIINSYVIAKIATSIVMGVNDPVMLAGTAQFFFDNCFSDFNTNGIVAAEFDSGASVRVSIIDGKVEIVDHTGFEDVQHIANIKYMSTGMRTFDDIKVFLNMRNMVKRMIGDDMESYIVEMMKSYRFYDFEHVETIIGRMPLEVEHRFRESMEKFEIKENIISFGFDEKKPDFFLVEKTENGEEMKYLTSYGKGHQSIFNMFLANLTL